MTKSLKLFVVALSFASVASAAPIVGGEGAGASTSMSANASMNQGALTIALSGVVGTDAKAIVITPNPVPDGSTVCLKANGQQSSDWKGGHTLGKIVVAPEACSWGQGVVQGGKVVVTVARDKACPSGRGEAAAVISGVVQLPDGKQAWVPHPAPYRVFNAKGVDATAITFNCSTGQVAPVAADQARVMAKLF